MTKPMQFTGRLWRIEDSSGRLIDDIDTDMIFHNAHLHITELSRMGAHAFGNLDGYQDFPSHVTAGDIVLVGRNFGCGSSRQQAVDCFAALGVSLLIAESFGAIYKRNAINSGFPILTFKPGTRFPAHLSEVSVDLEKGELIGDDYPVALESFSAVQRDIYLAGGLLKTVPGA